MGNITDKQFTDAALMWSRGNVTSITNLILESSNQNLRKECITVLDRAFNYQQQIYDIMAQKGWYPTQIATQQQVSTAKQQVEQQVNNVLNTAQVPY